MQRPSNFGLSIAVVVFTYSCVAVGGRLCAQESTKPVEAIDSAGARTATDHTGGATVEGADASAEPVNPMKPEPRLAIWTLVVFLGLLTVLGRYAWKPLIHALHEREKHLEHVLLETERARNESESLLSEHRRQMARAADEVRAILEKARQDAQATGEQIVKLAQGEAEAAKERAGRDIAAARDQALAEIWQTTADMAVSVAGRVLSKEISEGEHRRLLDVAIRELPAAPRSNGQGGKPA